MGNRLIGGAHQAFFREWVVRGSLTAAGIAVGLTGVGGGISHVVEKFKRRAP